MNQLGLPKYKRAKSVSFGQFLESRLGRYLTATFMLVVLLVLPFWAVFGLSGFNPTDDGFVLAQSHRILSGQIPHTDFTSPRPVGSGYLHAATLWITQGSLALSRLIVVVEFAIIALLGSYLAVRSTRSPTKYLLLYVAIAFLFGVNAWPIMAWHTVDGLVFSLTAVSFAFAAATSTHRRIALMSLSWFFAGIAPVMKQSFIVAPIAVALVYVGLKAFKAFSLAPLAMAPGIAYLIAVRETPWGLLSELVSDSSSSLLSPLAGLVSSAIHPIGILTILATIVVAWRRIPLPMHRTDFRLVVLAVCVLPTLFAGLITGFPLGGRWAWLPVLQVVTLIVLGEIERTARIVGISLVVLSYGTALSWGAGSPSLMTGTSVVWLLAVNIARFSGHSYESPISRNRPQATEHSGSDGAIIRSGVDSQAFTDSREKQTKRTERVALVVILVLALFTISFVRIEGNYREPGILDLHGRVDHPSFMGIRMSLNSAEYINQLVRCVRRYPAESVSIIPDGPGMYALLNLDNPFHFDWWLGLEQPEDHRLRVVETVAELNNSSDWLILIQTIDAASISYISLTEMTDDPTPFVHDAEDLEALSELNGLSVRCKFWQGFYKPKGIDRQSVSLPGARFNDMQNKVGLR